MVNSELNALSVNKISDSYLLPTGNGETRNPARFYWATRYIKMVRLSITSILATAFEKQLSENKNTFFNCVLKAVTKILFIQSFVILIYILGCFRHFSFLSLSWIYYNGNICSVCTPRLLLDLSKI